jgi:hypothetical protein
MAQGAILPIKFTELLQVGTGSSCISGGDYANLATPQLTNADIAVCVVPALLQSTSLVPAAAPEETHMGESDMLITPNNDSRPPSGLTHV